MSFTNILTRQTIKNYIADGTFASGNTQAFTPYNDGATATPVDGIGGTNTTAFIPSVNSSTPIEGSYSLDIIKSAGNQQGNGISIPITIDSGDKGKVLRVAFDYKILSGTYADNDVDVYIYDVTNATLIQPAPFHIKNHLLASDSLVCEFQTSTTSTSYRIIFHCASTSTAAYTLTLDNVFIGRLPKTYGSPTNDWISYTPTGSWTTNTTYTGWWRKVGDQMEVRVKVSTSGAPTAAGLTVNIPSGFTIDTTKMNSPTANFSVVLGQVTINDSSTTGYKGHPVYSSTTSILLAYQSAVTGLASAISNTAPFAFGAGDSVETTFTVPIVGWSSSQVMSSDADTRVVAFAALGTAPTATAFNGTAAAIFPSGAISFDTHGAYNATTGSYTCFVPGIFSVKCGLRYTGTFAINGYAIGHVHVGGVRKASFESTSAAATTSLSCGGSVEVKANAGDIIQIFAETSATGPAFANNGASLDNFLSIARLSGPVQIAASESVGAAFNQATATLTGSLSDVTWVNKENDSHNAMGATTYTIPMAGRYNIVASLNVSATTIAAGNGVQLSIMKNGVEIRTAFLVYEGTNTAAQTLSVHGMSISLVTGDLIKIQALSQATSPVVTANTARNYFGITRIGN